MADFILKVLKFFYLKYLSTLTYLREFQARYDQR